MSLTIRSARKSRNGRKAEGVGLPGLQAIQDAMDDAQKRDPHILNEAKGTNGYAERVIVFDTETWARSMGLIAAAALGVPHTLTMGWATFHLVSRGYDSLDERKDTCEFTEKDQFWDFVESKTVTSKPLYVFAHNISFDLRVVAFTDQLEKRGWVSKEAFLPDPNGPFKLTFTKEVDVLYKGQVKKRPMKIIFMDSGNFYGKRSLRDLGGILGFSKEDVDPTAARFNPETCVEGTKAFKELSHYCRRDTDIVGKLIDFWVKFCKDNALGPFGMTIASQAFNAYRARFMKTEIFIHNNEEVLDLEMAAMNGGLTDNFKVGNWKATGGVKNLTKRVLHVLDVKSMYPSIMVNKPVPVKLIGFFKGSNIGHDIKTGVMSRQGRIDWVLSMINGGYATVGKVKINTGLAEEGKDRRWLSCVPTVWNDKLVYPTGEFTTTLNTPDLQRAIERGIVEDILELALYEQEVIFTEYVEFFFGKRAEYKAAGNGIMEELCKLFLNSLFGKFGQCTYKWEPYGENLLDGNASETFYDLDTDQTFHFRQIGGLCEVRSRNKRPSMNSFIAVSGHITSYARCYLRTLIETAGFDNVGYCDTDSVFCNAVGYENLVVAGYVAVGRGARLGELEDELQVDEMNLRTLKDYDCWGRGYLDGGKFVYNESSPMIKAKQRIKGVRAGAAVGFVKEGKFVEDPRGDSFMQDQFQGMAGALREGLKDGVKITKVIKKPTHAYTKGVVDEFGTVWPLHLEGDLQVDFQERFPVYSEA